MKPLDGIRVLDLSRLLPGGLATMLLADLGADVLKVEQPGRGDYVRWLPPLAGEQGAYFLLLNRGKRSMTLDLKAPAGRDLLLRLVADADVLVDSFRPGVLDRLDLGWAVLRQANPRLVYVPVTGYGQDGPRAARGGHDMNYLAVSGALDLLGDADGPPVVPGFQVADLAGGAFCAVIGVLAALRERDRTGRGSLVDVAMVDGLMALLPAAIGLLMAGESAARGVTPLGGGMANYRIYETQDGRHLAVGPLEPQFWQQLCAAIERPDLAGAAYGDAGDQARLRATLADVFRSRTLADWQQRFARVDACVEPVLTVAEALTDPHTVARGVVDWHPDAPPEGRAQIHFPIRFDGERPHHPAAPPAFGADTDAVLAALGLDAAVIAALRRDGVV